jgi:uncharacterized membrane protein HdeD (DUF308 family)
MKRKFDDWTNARSLGTLFIFAGAAFVLADLVSKYVIPLYTLVGTFLVILGVVCRVYGYVIKRSKRKKITSQDAPIET